MMFRQLLLHLYVTTPEMAEKSQAMSDVSVISDNVFM